MRIRSALVAVLVGITVGTVATAAEPAATSPAGEETAGVNNPTTDTANLEFFEKQVRPLLVERCGECHTGEKPKGGFRLDSREHAVAGGDTGAAIIPGKPDESLLIDAIRYGSTYQMPPKGKLPDEEVTTLVEWVKRDAPWTKSSTPVATTAAAPAFDFEQRAKHWCFQPLANPQPPAVNDATWPAGEIDRFILAGLEAKGFAPAPPVEKRAWLRRVTYDLIGLPPTPAEMAAFLADESPAAFARVVDRLLASPHYGERRARQWLDLARFAETYGHEHDYEIPRAFEYRDYLIRAFNADLPYDQLVVEQLAGDLLDKPRRHPTEHFNESILGTAFYFVGEGVHSPVDVRKDGADRVDNQIDVLAKTFLALTVSCARCHDHKFDAIRQQDYYALAGYLRSSRYQQAFIDDESKFLAVRDALCAARAQERDEFKSYAAGALSKRTERIAGWLTDPARAKDDAWKAMLAEAAAQSDHLFHAWATLTSGPAGVSDEEFSRRRDELVARLSKKPADDIFADFDRTDFGGWIATGRAFGTEPVAPGDLVRADGAIDVNSPRPSLRPASVSAAHSGRLAFKLRGALRSPTFTITQPKIHYRLWGTSGQVRLIVDGLQLIQDPIYGGLKFAASPDKPHWHTQDVSKWIGHRAYIELLDDDDGYLALDRVVFSAGGTPESPANPLIVGMLQNALPKNARELADAYDKTLLQAIIRTTGGEVKPADAENTLIAGLIASPAATMELLDLPPELFQAERKSLQRLAEMAQERESLSAKVPPSRQALAMAAGTPEDERLFIRGNHKTLGDVVPRRGLEVLGGVKDPAPKDRAGRLEFAHSLVDGHNPLAPRVIANRLWHWHFGRGIVPSTDDFGAMGQAPTNPELLDWLAGELIRQKWSLKAIDRQIVLSSAYRMSEHAQPAALAADPENKLWSHRPRRRLDAESIRDAVLAVSGRLDRKMFGPGVAPHLTEFMAGRGKPTTSGPLDGAGRRSIYINVRRNFLTPMLLAFDYPTPFTTIGRRGTSNVPAQALTMLNNPLVAEQAELWARRVLAENSEPRERVAQMYAEAFGRPPTAAEQESVATFLAEQSSHYPPSEPLRAWADLAHVLLNTKEFIFIE